MAFQRSYSKVWWASEDPVLSDGGNIVVGRMGTNAHQLLAANNGDRTSGPYHSNSTRAQQQQPTRKQQQQQDKLHSSLQQSAYQSLSLNPYKCFNGNLSCIQEVEGENNSPKTTWPKHNSPGSLRSQDSGFSDNEEYLSSRSSKTVSPSRHSMRSIKSDFGSPTSVRSVNTPPTVIRRIGRSEFYTPLVNVSRRISFSGAPINKSSTNENSMRWESKKEEEEEEFHCSFKSKNFNRSCSSDAIYLVKQDDEKRPKKLNRRNSKPLSPSAKKSLSTLYDNFEKRETIRESPNTSIAEYNNETVYLGTASLNDDSTASVPSYNNETVLLGASLTETSDQSNTLSFLRLSQNRFESHTSTPKMERSSSTLMADQSNKNSQICQNITPSIHSWISDLRLSYEHEVMSTLQTKSIAQEAFKNLTITTNTVAKLIRQLQQKALQMQTSFERIERLIIDAEQSSLSEALNGAVQLIEQVQEFTQLLQRRGVFFADSRLEHKRFEDQLHQISVVAKDTRYSVERQHYINLESLLEDLQVLKRHLLITVRQVYVKLLHILIQSIEHHSRKGSDLMLRANINMIATLMNIDYDGFASLTDAFVQTEAVRTLLLVCLDHVVSSVRAMALRALATICCTAEPIAQLSSCGGIEILRDILRVEDVTRKDSSGLRKRSDLEKREAVSLLTQITAHWHGSNHRVIGLRSCVESMVEGLTDLLADTECSQTLLLCAAVLNNFSRMEVTAHYSIMSHETIFKLINATKRQNNEENGDTISIFLYEQIVAMLHNMSQNKKCHSHLANANIINFITYAYQTEFYKSYSSRGESEAQRRAIKYILHTLARLTQDSVLGMELLDQQQHMPCAAMFFKNLTACDKQQFLPLDSSHSRDISFLARQLLQEQNQEQQQQLQKQQELQQQTSETENDQDGTEKLKMQLARQESYV